jgi:hypothetical protein
MQTVAAASIAVSSAAAGVVTATTTEAAAAAGARVVATVRSLVNTNGASVKSEGLVLACSPSVDKIRQPHQTSRRIIKIMRGSNTAGVV